MVEKNTVHIEIEWGDYVMRKWIRDEGGITIRELFFNEVKSF